MSSLTCILEYYRSKYDISIMALSHDGSPNEIIQNHLLGKNYLCHAYYCSYTNSRGLGRCIIVIVKLLKRIFNIIKIDVEFWLCRLSGSFYKEYDTVIAFQEGSATKYVSNLPKVNKLAWVHCDYTNYPRCGTELNIYKQFSKIICVSKFTALKFVHIYPTLAQNTISIHNLLNVDYISRMAKYPIDDTRFISDTFTIISVGRIDKVKRFDQIPEIASNLLTKGYKFKWFIIGPEYGDSTFQKFQDNILNYGVSHNVIYLGNKHNPYPYFVNANLLVSLSYTEACPMIFNEAKVLNLPVVTTDFGSSYEFISNGENGYINTLQNITYVIASLIDDKSLYDLLKKNISSFEYSNSDILIKLDTLFKL